MAVDAAATGAAIADTGATGATSLAVRLARHAERYRWLAACKITEYYAASGGHGEGGCPRDAAFGSPAPAGRHTGEAAHGPPPPATSSRVDADPAGPPRASTTHWDLLPEDWRVWARGATFEDLARVLKGFVVPAATPTSVASIKHTAEDAPPFQPDGVATSGGGAGGGAPLPASLAAFLGDARELAAGVPVPVASSDATSSSTASSSSLGASSNKASYARYAFASVGRGTGTNAGTTAPWTHPGASTGPVPAASDAPARERPGGGGANRPTPGPSPSTTPTREKRSPTDAIPAYYFHGVKEKKVHEIVQLAPLVDAVAREVGATHIVDIGAGRGYLSRLLAGHYGWKVIAVEAQQVHVDAGKALDRSVWKTIEKQRRAGGGGGGDVAIANTNGNADGRQGHSSSQGDHHHHLHPIACGLPMRWVRATVKGDDIAVWEELLDSGARDVGGDVVVSTASGMGGVCEGSPAGSTRAPRGRRYVFIGLHSCGDLSSQLLRLAGAWDAVCGVVVVGCCFMHLTEAATTVPDGGAGPTPTTTQRRPACKEPANVNAIHAAAELAAAERPRGGVGFPMSELLRGVHAGAGAMNPADTAPAPAALHLGTQLRELACADLSGYAARLAAAADGAPEALGQLRLHSRRAVLEVIMRAAMRDAGVRLSLRSIPHAWKMTFDEYVATALERMGLAAPAGGKEKGGEEEGGGAPESHAARYEPWLARWRDVVAFNVLRLACAPPLERLIAADREVYLAERGMRAEVVPLFDPAVSPRNLAVVGVRGGRSGVASDVASASLMDSPRLKRRRLND